MSARKLLLALATFSTIVGSDAFGGHFGGNQPMSFGKAFARAHREQGPGGTFEWRGNSYSTNRADGRDLRARASAPSFSAASSRATPPQSFGNAFAAAHRAQGPGGIFEWQGNQFSTNRADGLDLSVKSPPAQEKAAEKTPALSDGPRGHRNNNPGNIGVNSNIKGQGQQVELKLYERAATLLGVSPAAIRAVADVEAAGAGFDSQNRVKILFEGHVLWKELEKAGKDPAKLLADNPGYANVLHEKPNRQYYKENQYDRLEKASKIDREAALKSASYGKYQIMGFNHAACGEKGVESFYKKMNESETQQVNLFIKFVESQPALKKALKEKDWEGFARKYNGPDFKKNNYDTKLKAAFEKYSK